MYIEFPFSGIIEYHLTEHFMFSRIAGSITFSHERNDPKPQSEASHTSGTPCPHSLQPAPSANANDYVVVTSDPVSVSSGPVLGVAGSGQEIVMADSLPVVDIFFKRSGLTPNDVDRHEPQVRCVTFVHIS